MPSGRPTWPQPPMRTTSALKGSLDKLSCPPDWLRDRSLTGEPGGLERDPVSGPCRQVELDLALTWTRGEQEVGHHRREAGRALALVGGIEVGRPGDPAVDGDHHRRA